AALGHFPSGRRERDNWTTKAVTDLLWKEGVPALSVIWLGQPDLTQHETGPGAAAALAAIKSSDEKLAVILSALESHGARDATDLFIVSDHGFSTIRRSIDLPKILTNAGFVAKTEFDDDEPKSGDIMLVGNGGSVLFYVIGNDPTVTGRLVEFLQQSDFAGVILTRQGLPGTFRLDDVNMESLHAPDVVMSFRWYDSKNQFGVPGMIDADWRRKAGGTHATLSPFDMHNTLIAAGPDFHHGQTDELPTGNVDLAPTILHILGIKFLQQMDGRVLFEAMAGTNQPSTGKATETKSVEATKEFPGGTWRQSLRVSRVGSTIYLDEGNGAFSPGAAKKAN